MSLKVELNYIHQKLFGFSPSQDLINQYEDAHLVYKAYIPVAHQMALNELVSRKIDLVSLEFFWRLKKKNNLLTQKFFILFYLTEVQPDYQMKYMSVKQDRFAFLKLATYTGFSILRFFKGALLFFYLKINDLR